MLAALSAENQFRKMLDELGCAANSFAECWPDLISKTKLSLCLNGQKTFDHETEPKLMAAIQEMMDLAAHCVTPPDWKATAAVQAALVQRRAVRKLVADVDRIVKDGTLLREQYAWLRTQ